MKESFANRAEENLKAAELLFDNCHYNASANRAYYAAFHAAIAALFSIGLTPTIDHKNVRTLFSDNFFNRRKVLPSKYNGFLSDLQKVRNVADYKEGINMKKAKTQMRQAKEFIEIIFEEIK